MPEIADQPCEQRAPRPEQSLSEAQPPAGVAEWQPPLEQAFPAGHCSSVRQRTQAPVLVSQTGAAAWGQSAEEAQAPTSLQTWAIQLWKSGQSSSSSHETAQQPEGWQALVEQSPSTAQVSVSPH